MLVTVLVILAHDWLSANSHSALELLCIMRYINSRLTYLLNAKHHFDTVLYNLRLLVDFSCSGASMSSKQNQVC